MSGGEVADVLARLEALRLAEKEQALLYRGIAALAERAEQPDLAQRFHDLHADEQHHLSRLTVRILELGGRPADLSHVRVEPGSTSDWEGTIRTRETAEIDRYRHELESSHDEATRALLLEIVGIEEHHSRELGGKWTMA
ncbi:MAG: ferritin-like domain-containing protein [Gemmatimonadota bacterium]